MTSVVFCASEAAPFAKVGGLGDVVGSLPKSLVHLGVDPVIVLPRYGFIEPGTHGLEKLDIHFEVYLLGQSVPVEVWKTFLPGVSGGRQVPVYLLEQPRYFGGRQSVYPADPRQETEGFYLLSKALFPLLKHLNLSPDILHLHDWHTAAAAVELLEQRSADPFFHKTCSVLTIHNVAYQGIFEKGGINWLGEGIRCADFVTAVSPTYAQEILTPEGGAGLDGLLRAKGERLLGILNGLDTAILDPMNDAFIPENYNRQTVHAGKGLCKRALQQELGLSVHPEIPLIGMVTRLVEQKGLDLMLPVMNLLMGRPAQWVILGSGEPGYEAVLREMNPRYKNFVAYIGFNLSLAQKIYAGSDMFLMPSRFEPCGLGQMIALRYGTVPIVRATGGLADTVTDIRSDAILGNGFSFEPYQSSALLEAVDAALAYYKDGDAWQRLVQTGMAEDFAWEGSAKKYREVYRHLVQAHV